MQGDRKIKFWAVNGGRKLGSPGALSSFLSRLSVFHTWHCLFVSETDGVHADEHDDIDALRAAAQPHLFVRHYGGQGNTAAAVIINSKIVSKVAHIKWATRAAAVTLKHAGQQPLTLIGLHGYTDNLDETIGMVNDLVTDRATAGPQNCIVAGD